MSINPIVSVEDLTHDARGVATYDGKKVFIKKALPNEKVSFSVYKKRIKFDEANLHELIEPSPDRTEPACEVYGICGGCQLQHFDLQAQVKQKQKHLLGELQKLNITVELIAAPIISTGLYYRRKARLGVRYVNKKQKVLVGFREAKGSFITDTESCKILVKPFDILITPLSELIQKLSIYNKLPQVEIIQADNANALILRILDKLTTTDEQHILEFAKQYKVWIYLQPGSTNSIFKFYPLDENKLQYDLPEYNIKFTFNPEDFIQVNSDINKQMITQAINWLSLTADETVLDLFAGIGNFTLPLAKICKQVISVEGEINLVERARQNAINNNFENIKCYLANLFEPFKGLEFAKHKPDAILLDPPRSGAEYIVNNIEHFNPNKILYVSCNPATFARDAAILINKGYALKKACVMDMFSHTVHIETMGLFEL